MLKESAIKYMKNHNSLFRIFKYVVRNAVVYANHAKRKLITSMDVVYDLKRQGRYLYGFGP